MLPSGVVGGSIIVVLCRVFFGAVVGGVRCWYWCSHERFLQHRPELPFPVPPAALSGTGNRYSNALVAALDVSRCLLVFAPPLLCFKLSFPTSPTRPRPQGNSTLRAPRLQQDHLSSRRGYSCRRDIRVPLRCEKMFFFSSFLSRWFSFSFVRTPLLPRALLLSLTKNSSSRSRE